MLLRKILIIFTFFVFLNNKSFCLEIKIKAEIDNIIKISLDKLEHSTDLYEFSKDLNSSFTYQDKIDFICCLSKAP